MRVFLVCCCFVIAGSADELGPLPREVKVDAAGDPLPREALARLGTVRWRSQERLFFIAFSADERSLWTCSPTQFVDYDRATGTIRRAWTTRLGGKIAQAAALAPDRSTIYIVGDFPGVRCWATATGKELPQFADSDKDYHQIAISADGQHLALAHHDNDQSTIDLWNRRTGKIVWSIVSRMGISTVMTFAPNGTVLAFATCNRSVQVHEVATGKEQYSLDLDDVANTAEQLAFTPDSQLLWATSVGGTNGWNMRTGQPVELKRGPPRGFGRGLAISPDGKTAAEATYKGLIIWDLPTRKERHFFPGLGGASRLVFAKDGTTLLTAVAGCNLQLIDTTNGRWLLSEAGHQHSLRGAIFAPDGRTLLSWGDDFTLHRWDLTTGRLVGGEKNVNVDQVGFTADGQTIVGLGHEAQYVWDGTLRRQEKRSREGGYLETVLAPDGRLAALLPSFGGGTIKLIDPITGMSLREFGSYRERVTRAEFGLDQRLLIVAAERESSLNVWDTRTGKIWRELDYGYQVLFEAGRGLRPPLFTVSPDGRMLAAHAGSANLRLWDLTTGALRHEFRTLGRTVTTLAFTADNRTLLIGEPGEALQYWRLGDERPFATLAVGRLHPEWRQPLVIAPDGQRVATLHQDTTIMVWSVPHPPKSTPTPRLFADLWRDLEAPDAQRAFSAMRTLEAQPAYLPFVVAQVPAVQPPNAARIAQLLADLDSARFAIREQATHELAAFGVLVAPALRAARAQTTSAEVRERCTTLLAKLDPPPLDVHGADLRVLRVVEMLEHWGTPAARAHLQTLAAGVPDARLTHAARAALERLRRRV